MSNSNSKLPILEKGQSLFEVLFSIAIISIILIALVSLVAGSVRNSDFSQNNALATKYVQEASEWIRQYRDADWNEFKTRSGGGSGSTWCIDTLPYPPPTWGLVSACTGTIPGTPFTREMNLVDDTTDPDLVHVTIVASWEDSQGMHTVKSISSLSNWNR